jgi:hypothetical protein
MNRATRAKLEENFHKCGSQPREISDCSFGMMDGPRFAEPVTPALPGSIFWFDET